VGGKKGGGILRPIVTYTRGPKDSWVAQENNYLVLKREKGGFGL